MSLIKALFELRDVHIPLCCHPGLHCLLRFQVNNSRGIYGCAWYTVEKNPISCFSIETQWPMSSRSFSLLCCTNYYYYLHFLLVTPLLYIFLQCTVDKQVYPLVAQVLPPLVPRYFLRLGWLIQTDPFRRLKECVGRVGKRCTEN